MAKRRRHGKRVADQGMDLVVAAVSQEHQALLRIRGKRDVPRRSADLSTVKLRVDQGVLDERPVFPEDLDALVAAIADIQQAVIGPGDAVRRVELLAWWTAAIKRRH